MFAHHWTLYAWRPIVKWQLAICASGKTAAAWLAWVDVSLSVVGSKPPIPPTFLPALQLLKYYTPNSKSCVATSQVVKWGEERHTGTAMCVRQRKRKKGERKFIKSQPRGHEGIQVVHKNKAIICPSCPVRPLPQHRRWFNIWQTWAKTEPKQSDILLSFRATQQYSGEVDECLDLGMWSRDENVGQSDTGKASMAVDKRYSYGSGRERNKASLKHSCSGLEMWKTI